MASGMKMIDLATRSNWTLSARTAMARPSEVASKVTAKTHHRLLTIVPRSVVTMAKKINAIPPMPIAPDGGSIWVVWPVLRPRARVRAGDRLRTG